MMELDIRAADGCSSNERLKKRRDFGDGAAMEINVHGRPGVERQNK